MSKQGIAKPGSMTMYLMMRSTIPMFCWPEQFDINLIVKKQKISRKEGILQDSEPKIFSVFIIVNNKERQIVFYIRQDQNDIKQPSPMSEIIWKQQIILKLKKCCLNGQKLARTHTHTHTHTNQSRIGQLSGFKPISNYLGVLLWKWKTHSFL